MRIGDYDCLTAFATAGSGSARWCRAEKDGRAYFLKQFLSPLRPADDAKGAPALLERRRARCDDFEKQKRRLYDALSCVLGDSVVPVSDFFLHEGRYYAASEYIPTPFETLDTIGGVTPKVAQELLYHLSCCLTRLHTQGIVHADLKPEHVLLQANELRWRVRLIDFDSGFPEDAPPQESREVEGDPVFLAPETFLSMTGDSQPLTRKIDTFAFGAMAHLLWTGDLPAFNREQCHYLYEAVLSGEPIELSPIIPPAYRWLIRRALSRNPAERPDDALIVRLLEPRREEPAPVARVNGMSRYLRTDTIQF